MPSRTAKKVAKKAIAKAPARTAQRTVTAKKTAKKRRPLSKEAKAKLSQNLIKARAKRAENAKARAEGRETIKKAPPSKMTKMGRSLKIKAYLVTVRDTNGADEMSTSLTGIPGVKGGKSTDPVTIEKAARALELAVHGEDNPLKEMKMLQRVRDLDALAVKLQATNGDSPEATFIAEGAGWAEDMGFEYETLRTYGIPARVLKAAGIER